MTSLPLSAQAAVRSAAMAAATFLLSASLSVATEDAAPADAPAPITVYRDTADLGPGGPADQLLERARRQGEVRVIVGLRIVTRMPHTLTPAAAAQQRAAQRRVEDALIQRVFGAAAAPGIVRFDVIPYVSMFVDAEQLGRLLASPEVVSLHEDVPEKPQLGVSVPLIHATDIFAKGFNGTGQVVAVIDSGVATSHPMFAGKIVSEACYSTNRPPDYASFCPGGAAESTEPGSGVNCPTTLAGCDHGTHVASIAAGNSNQLDGVARDAGIIAIKVASHDLSDDSLSLTITDTIKALERVLELKNAFKIAAVNMSLGGSRKFTDSTRCDRANQPRKMAIDNLRAVGIATIVASGNDGFSDGANAPACISSVIAVGNTTKTDVVHESSNHSPLVKLMAPGTQIRAAVPKAKLGVQTGTSQATPHVAGAFAMLRNIEPKATVNEMLEALTCSGKVVDQRYDDVFGFEVELDPARPRIDLLGAFYALRKPKNVKREWLFSAERETLDWTPFRGTWAWNGTTGSYGPSPVEPGWAAASVANCDTALVVEARMKRVSAAPFLNGTGVWVKTTLNHTDELASGYFFSYSRGISAGTPFSVAQVFKLESYNLETSQCGASCSILCEENDFPGVLDDGFNTVKVSSRGASHTYYLNGLQVCTFNDAAFATGAVMVAASIPNGFAGEDFDIDFVKIQKLDAALVADDTDPVMNPAAFADLTHSEGRDRPGRSTRRSLGR